MQHQLGYRGECLMLAFDHRDLFVEMVSGSDVDVPTVKRAIFDGARLAAERRSDDHAARRLGIFVDNRFGAEIAREAKERDLLLAMPVERSGAPEFEFDADEAFGERIEDFDPDFNKVLVRMGPGQPADAQARQVERLRRLSDWLHERGRLLLFELILQTAPGEPAGDRRGELTLAVMREVQAAGIEPDIWKLEPSDDTGDYARYVEQARSGGRDDVACVLLGGGGSAEVIGEAIADATRGGFAGFTVGRTIWREPAEGLIRGELSPAEAAERMAQTYCDFIDTYTTTTSGASR